MNKPEHLTPNQDFDWEAYEQGTTALHEDRQADLEKYEATLANVKEKEVVKAASWILCRARQKLLVSLLSASAANQPVAWPLPNLSITRISRSGTK